MSTTRDLILASREAFVKGIKTGHTVHSNRRWFPSDEQNAKDVAAILYPMTESRPRVIKLPFRYSTHEFKIEGNVLYRRNAGSRDWWPTQWTREMHEQILHLFKTPTETVQL